MRYMAQIKASAALLVILAMVGCTRLTVVNINAITSTSQTQYGNHYILTQAAKPEFSTGNNDLYFQEFRRYFDYVLQKQGYLKADSRQDADIEIRFSYGVSDGKTGVQTFSWPIYETYGGDSYTVTEKITDNNGNTSTIRRTVYMPPYVRQVGNSVEMSSYTLFNRYANLAAFPISHSETNTVTPLWNLNVYSVGESDDLRVVMPYLAAASFPFLGKNSSQQLSVTMREDNPLLMELRGLNSKPQ